MLHAQLKKPGGVQRFRKTAEGVKILFVPAAAKSGHKVLQRASVCAAPEAAALNP